jgi:hypothetical protein
LSSLPRSHEFADPVAGDVAAEIDHVQADAALFQLREHIERIERRAEHAIELRGDDHVAGLDDREQLGAFGPLADRLRS